MSILSASLRAGALVLLLLPAAAVRAAGPANPALIDAQRAALAPLAIFDGAWRGEAEVLQPDGTRMKLVQTERVGPMLGGTLRIIEGRGYAGDGALVFNAMAVVSFSPQSGRYLFRSYAQGYSGDFPMEVRSDGFTWTAPAGPGASLRYTATVRDGVWREVGERIVAGQPPVRTFEMTLRRIGDVDWPAAGAIDRGPMTSPSAKP